MMFNYLRLCSDKLKADYVLWVPYLAYSLFFSIVNKYVFKGIDSFGFKEFVIFYLENICQTIVGVLLVLMIKHLKDKPLDLTIILGMLKKKLQNNLLRFSIIINFPVAFLIFLVTYFSSSLGVDSVNSFLTVLIVGIALYMVVPISAFGYFVIINYVLEPKDLFVQIKDMFILCFKSYRVCIRWFVFIILINSLSIFVIPITLTDFILRDVMVAVFQSLFLTVSMVYSYYFYKDTIEKSLLLHTTITTGDNRPESDKPTSVNLNDNNSD